MYTWMISFCAWVNIYIPTKMAARMITAPRMALTAMITYFLVLRGGVASCVYSEADILVKPVINIRINETGFDRLLLNRRNQTWDIFL